LVKPRITVGGKSVYDPVFKGDMKHTNSSTQLSIFPRASRTSSCLSALASQAACAISRSAIGLLRPLSTSFRFCSRSVIGAGLSVLRILAFAGSPLPVATFGISVSWLFLPVLSISIVKLEDPSSIWLPWSPAAVVVWFKSL
jgi:hypothetical protein